jgi:hypothetical protein
LAQAGHHDQALQAATTITDPYGRARVLVEVARALAQAGHHMDAMRVVVVACSHGRWSTLMGLALRLDASVVDAFGDAEPGAGPMPRTLGVSV